MQGHVISQSQLFNTTGLHGLDQGPGLLLVQGSGVIWEPMTGQHNTNLTSNQERAQAVRGK